MQARNGKVIRVATCPEAGNHSKVQIIVRRMSPGILWACLRCKISYRIVDQASNMNLVVHEGADCREQCKEHILHDALSSQLVSIQTCRIKIYARLIAD